VILEAREVTVRYPGGTWPALDGVSLRVEAGRLLALVGPNGSGKTTLVRALLGTVSLSSGSALVDGRPVGAWPRQELSRLVGVVPQREDAWVPLRVEEAVLLGRYPHLGPLSPITAADWAAVKAALERCDVWQLRDRTVDALSGGEWQRVRIARALAQEPKVLVLDEPAAALDVRHEMEVMELVRELVDGGLACLLITHHLNLAARYADRMALLACGQLIADGAPAEVLGPEVVSKVFGWPVTVLAGPDGVPQLFPLRPQA
jgi:iron complex transport system ATP-binding protein